MTAIRHLINPTGAGEHAFCGLAFDADPDIDGFDPKDVGDLMGVDDQRSVTCPQCCQAVDEIRAAIKGRRFAPQKDGE